MKSRFVGHLTLSLAAIMVTVAGAPSGVKADLIDLVNGTNGTANGALFFRADFQSAGTGVIDSFVRVQHDNGPSHNDHSPTGEEQGYNTSGRPVQYDELTDPNYTRNLLFSDIPIVSINNILYKEFILDINEPNGGVNSLISLDQVRIYTSATGGQTGLEGTLGILRYSLGASLDDNVVTLDYNLNSGSGQGDMRMDVPLSSFPNVSDSSLVYLYSYFGHYMPTDYQTGDGFEEWAVRVPTPGTGALLAFGGLLGARRRRGRAQNN